MLLGETAEDWPSSGAAATLVENLDGVPNSRQKPHQAPDVVTNWEMNQFLDVFLCPSLSLSLCFYEEIHL